MKLVELRAEYRNILEAIEASCDEGGVIDPALMATLNGVVADIETKLGNYAGIIVHLSAQQKIIGGEIERLSKQYKSAGEHVAFLKDVAKSAMVEAGMTKLENGVRKLSICGNGGKKPVKISNPDKVLEAYWVQPPKEIDSETLRHDLELGIPVEGATLEERGTHLRVT